MLITFRQSTSQTPLAAHKQVKRVKRAEDVIQQRKLRSICVTKLDVLNTAAIKISGEPVVSIPKRAVSADIAHDTRLAPGCINVLCELFSAM